MSFLGVRLKLMDKKGPLTKRSQGLIKEFDASKIGSFWHLRNGDWGHRDFRGSGLRKNCKYQVFMVFRI